MHLDKWVKGGFFVKNNNNHHRLIALLCVIGLLGGALLCPPAASGAPETKGSMVVAYITSWNWQDTIDATKLTHINYAFGMVRADGSVSIPQDGNLNKLVALKAVNPQLKVLLSMQQVAAGDFCTLAQTQEGRETFARNCKTIVDSFGLDGIDVDWEYPGYNIQTGEITCPNCKEDFTKLLQEIRLALGEEKLLTIACGISEYLQHYTDFPAINPYLDFFNLMAYDYQVGSISGHQSNLYPGSAGSEGWGLSGDSGVRLLLSKGVPAEKLNLGVPFYSRTSDGGEYRYDQIQRFLDQGYVYHFDEAAKQSYLTYGGTFAVAYDDVRTIQCKADYVKEKGLGGMMYWEYGQDDGNHTLSNAVWDSLMGEGEDTEALQLQLSTGTTAAAGSAFTFRGEASGGKGDYTYAAYVFCNGRRIFQNQCSGSPDFSFTPFASGDYVICLYCFDSVGNMASAQGAIAVV